jgi:DNA-binding GntR family transcriptional regulator
MSNEAATAERVYSSLKEALLSGRLSPHARLDFAEIARRLGASTTRVRESAMRLLGEGLLESDYRFGMRPIRWSEYRLRALFDWHEKMVRLAIDWGGDVEEALPAVLQGGPYEERARIFFGQLAGRTGNGELVAAIYRTADALAACRRVEPLLLPDANVEVEQLQSFVGTPALLRRAVRSYHRRRRALAAKLAWAMSAEAQTPRGWD